MILGFDPGMENPGWSLLADDGEGDRPGQVLACSVITTTELVRPPKEPGGEPERAPMNVGRPNVAGQIAGALGCIIGEHRCWRAGGAGDCPAEAVELAWPERKVTRVISEEMGSFGAEPAIVNNCLPWGVIVTIAVFLGAPLYKVSPKKWQSSIIKPVRGQSIDYNGVRAAVEKHVRATAHPVAVELLDAMPARRRGHALDAAAVGICLSMDDPARPRVTRVI